MKLIIPTTFALAAAVAGALVLLPGDASAQDPRRQDPEPQEPEKPPQPPRPPRPPEPERPVDRDDEERKEPRKEGEPLRIGDSWALTDVEMLATDGEQYSLDRIKGEKGTLVVFTCNHCPWVVKWEDRMTKLGNDYRDKGVGVIFVNSNEPKRGDDYESMQQRAKERGFEFPYAVDEHSQLAREFGATRTPEAFLFDAKGKLVYHGTIDDDANDPKAVEKHFLRDAMEALIHGRKIEPATTKALGCGIKFRPKKERPSEQ